MRLVSWNVNRAVVKQERQAAALLARKPDMVALQEVTATTVDRWRELLPHAVSGLDRAPADRQPAGPRRLAAFVASRWPIEPVEPPAVPWPETVVSVLVHAPAGAFELHSLHVPNSRNGWIKVETCEAVHARLARAAPGDPPRMLCGDFNTPRRETPAGQVVTFARDRYRRLRPERGERWDAAEASLLAGIPGMVDIFRALNGWELREPSWTWPRFPRSGYRLDHLIASPELDFTRCAYLHELRTEGLSDHAALEADFDGAA